MTKRTTKNREVRVYGNQHGTWIEISGKMLELVLECCEIEKITPEEFVLRAIDHYISLHKENHEVDS